MSELRQVLEEFELQGVLRTSAQSTLFEATAPGAEYQAAAGLQARRWVGRRPPAATAAARVLRTAIQWV